MTGVELYWLTRLDAIRSMLVWFTVIPFVVATVYSAYLLCLCMDSPYYSREPAVNKNQMKKFATFWLVFCTVFVIVLVVNTFIPSTKDALIIQGIDKLTNSPEVQKLVGLIYERLQGLLMAAK